MTKKIGAGKTIMVAMPDVVGLSDMIIKNLEYHGFTVIDGTYRAFTYKNHWEKAYKFLRHIFLGERNYKSKKQAKRYIEDNLLVQFAQNNINKVDYTLFIHASIFEEVIFDKLQSLSKNNIAYHWDGLSIFPEIMWYIPKFERFFAFDIDDVRQNPELNLLNTTNFYFDFDEDEVALIAPYNMDNPSLYFVGRHWDDRTPMINSFLSQISPLDINPQIYILDEHHEGRDKYPGQPVIFMDKPMSFQDNLTKVKSCDILVDFVKAQHNGLSFRFFESIHYNKKLITNNRKVATYDLYDPDNVFIWDNNDLDIELLKDFINKPFKNIDESIKQKYGFENWIKYILDIEPHIKLDHHSVTINKNQ